MAISAKKAARRGSAIITDRGSPEPVLLGAEEYRRLTGERRSIAEALAMPGIADIEFDPPAAKIIIRPADFS